MSMYADPDPECDDDALGTAVSVGVPVAVTAVAVGAYVATYGLDRYLDYGAMLGPRGEWLQFAVLGGLVVAHGVVHALAYALLGEGSWRAVRLDVSTDPSGIDPVRVAVRPAGRIRRSAYALGVAAPGLLLGVAPAAWALVSGNPLAMFVGAVGLLICGSDAAELRDVLGARDAATAREFVAS